MYRWIVHVVLAAGLAAAATAGAANDKTERVLTAETRNAFEDQVAAIRTQLGSGGHYEFATPSDRQVIDRRFDEIAAILARYEIGAPLANDDKVALFVAQEDVNAILTKRDGRRLICESVTISGSHRKQKECVTLAERERARRDGQQYLHESNRKTVCLKCGETEVWGGGTPFGR